MQVLGLCRFSYPALGGFQVEHDTVEDRVRYLYRRDRLEQRFHLFETVALPGLRAQTDQDFTFLIVIGDSLPQPDRDRLHDLTAGMPQIRIIAQPPRPHREVMKEILNAARRSPDKPCLQFRHDDDDAVAVDFVARFRQAASDCSGLLRRNKAVAVDFNRGYLTEFHRSGIHVSEQIKPFLGVALGMYVRGGCPLTIMNFAHNKIARFMPAVSFSDTPMWVRSYNGHNDSSRTQVRRVGGSPLTGEHKSEFANRFAIDVDQVRTRVFTP